MSLVRWEHRRLESWSTEGERSCLGPQCLEAGCSEPGDWPLAAWEPPTIAADLCSFSFLTCEEECDVGSTCPIGWATGCPGMWLSMVSGGVCAGLS